MPIQQTEGWWDAWISMKKSCHPHASKDLKPWTKEKNKRVDQLAFENNIKINHKLFLERIVCGESILRDWYGQIRPFRISAYTAVRITDPTDFSAVKYWSHLKTIDFTSAMNLAIFQSNKVLSIWMGACQIEAVRLYCKPDYSNALSIRPLQPRTAPLRPMTLF